MDDSLTNRELPSVSRNAVSPSYPRVLLGEELRRARLAAGLSQTDLAAAVPCRQPKIAKLETAQIQRIKPAELDLILYRLGVTGARAVELRRFAEMPYADRGAWTATSVGETLWQNGKLRAESLASSIFSVQFDAHDGLTQCPEYMRRQFTLFGRDDVEKACDFRLARQAAVFDKPEPPHCMFVLSEGALYRDMNDEAMMVAQLEHLVGMTTAMPTVRVLILGFSAELPTQTYSFSIMEFASTVMTDCALVENRSSATVFDEPEVVRGYGRDKKTIIDACYDDGASVACIQRAIDHHRQHAKDV
jgi:transcriptional regulator with XRE-family HTH domain